MPTEDELLKMAVLLAAEETPGASAEALVQRAQELVALGPEHMRALGLMLRAGRQR